MSRSQSESSLYVPTQIWVNKVGVPRKHQNFVDLSLAKTLAFVQLAATLIF